MASLGVLNLHSGKLPDYRGVMATFRAMMAEDETLFSTVHWIDDKTIDTGRILSMRVYRETRRLLPEQCSESVPKRLQSPHRRG